MMQPTFEAFRAHAHQEAPRECCGLIVANEYRPCRNIATSDHFEIHPEDVIAAEQAGEVQAVCHSHPDSSPEPSGWDMEACAQDDVPWFILGANDSMQRIDPQPIPLLGRRFQYGWTDCYSLVRDRFALDGIVLPDFPRRVRFWEQNESPYLDHFAECGFEEVQALEPGDLILMRIQSKVPNHAAYALGKGRILHHLLGTLSSEEDIHRYLPSVTHILRYAR
jgi:proteasome lid subunit RPN8/RPN11